MVDDFVISLDEYKESVLLADLHYRASGVKLSPLQFWELGKRDYQEHQMDHQEAYGQPPQLRHS